MLNNFNYSNRYMLHIGDLYSLIRYYLPSITTDELNNLLDLAVKQTIGMPTHDETLIGRLYMLIDSNLRDTHLHQLEQGINNELSMQLVPLINMLNSDNGYKVKNLEILNPVTAAVVVMKKPQIDNSRESFIKTLEEGGYVSESLRREYGIQPQQYG